ncbi:SDR family NAD(P)-dependent oxidoreductase [Amycolatopsis anabasis]|uniref:SDR family NAD(P)-dependent oxidoreductase n=1 Tax=Amycolatopsis anabasis TaxID=1840409 RepID=UPI00131D97DD|nr:SDR family oxidoreductase [Amycolatopsis anabasis]
MAGSFQGRVALVTGAASGIGAATARTLADAGAVVVLADRDQKVTEVAGKLAAEGREVVAQRCDQTRPDEVTALVDRVHAEYERLDVCVANAGYGRAVPFLDTPLPVWQRTYDINVTGTFLVCQAAARRMVACGDGGSIVVTSSSGSQVPAALFSAYCSAKAALNMLVAVIAYELGAFGIRVNAVLPGVAETAMTKSLLDTGAREALQAELPLGRLAQPDDVAAAIAFLAGPESRYVSGASLLVDGAGSRFAPGWFATDFRTRGGADWRQRHERAGR